MDNPDLANLDYRQLVTLCDSGKIQCPKDLLDTKAREYDKELFAHHSYSYGRGDLDLASVFRRKYRNDDTSKTELVSGERTADGRPVRVLSMWISSNTLYVQESVIPPAESLLQTYWDENRRNGELRKVQYTSTGRREKTNTLTFPLNTDKDVDIAQGVLEYLTPRYNVEESRFWKSEMHWRIQKILHDVLYHGEPYSINIKNGGSIDFFTTEDGRRFNVRADTDLIYRIPNDGHIGGKDSRYWKITEGDLEIEDLESMYNAARNALLRGKTAEFNAYGLMKRILLMYFTGDPLITNTRRLTSGEPYWK